jgi:hypothetical protein
MMDRIDKLHQSFYQNRNVEKNDTRQAIQRHDPDFHKKQKNDDEQVEARDPYEDLTNVSVTALIDFLENLINTKSKFENQPVPDDENNKPIVKSETQNPEDKYRAKAVNAYQTRVQSTSNSSSSSMYGANTLNVPETAIDKATVNLDTVEIMKTLRGLHDLQNKGVLTISLSRGDGFLQTIQNAVAQV